MPSYYNVKSLQHFYKTHSHSPDHQTITYLTYLSTFEDLMPFYLFLCRFSLHESELITVFSYI